jgi:hypothetical protein
MGDRGNICLKYETGQEVWLYTHWSGSDLPQIVARALQKGESRWSDPSYLARVVFQELIGGDDSITGFGITPYGPSDNENPIVTIHLEQKVVTMEGDPNVRSYQGFINMQVRSDVC